MYTETVKLNLFSIFGPCKIQKMPRKFTDTEFCSTLGCRRKPQPILYITSCVANADTWRCQVEMTGE